MSLDAVVNILKRDDGSLPDINFDFSGARVAADAYELVQARATALASTSAYFWSKRLEAEVPISFGQNPAVDLLNGEAEAFHVVFGGLTSKSGAVIPDLGLFVLGVDFVALDYRMGPEWNSTAVEDLFDLMGALSNLSDCRITHTGNTFDPEGTILCSAFQDWYSADPKFQRTPHGADE